MSNPAGGMGADKVRVRARIEEMSQGEVIERIGSDRYRELTSRDGDAMFVELVAAHEGVSSGRLVTGWGRGGPARKFWSRERIGELVERLGSGLPVFVSHEGRGARRRPVGEMVAAAERWLKGSLSAAGIACIRDASVGERIRSGELDACSIEAEIECHRDPAADDGCWIVDAVRKVSGIALGDSRREKPGFAHAGVVTALACEFEDGKEVETVAVSANPEIESFVSRTEELEKKVAAQERRIAELSEEVARRRSDDRSRSGIAAPPERPRSSPGNPLIPR